MVALIALIVSSQIAVDDSLKAVADRMRSEVARIQGTSIVDAVPGMSENVAPANSRHPSLLRVWFDYPDETVISVASGFKTVEFYGKNPNSSRKAWPTQRVSDEFARTRAELYAKAAGLPTPLKITSVEEERNGEPPNVLVTCASTIDGVQVGEGSDHQIHLDPATGDLLEATFGLIPKPPTSLMPTISKEGGRASFLNYLNSPSRFNNYPSLDPNPVRIDEAVAPRLSIIHLFKSALKGQGPALTAAEKARVLSDQGFLCWIYEYRIPGTAHSYIGYVDAQTSRLLWLGDFAFVGGGPVPPNLSRKVHLMQWDTGADEATVIVGKRNVRIKDAWVSFVKTSKATDEAQKFTLVLGRSVLRCGYDKARGLIFAEQDGIRSYGRPNAPLKAAIVAAFK